MILSPLPTPYVHVCGHADGAGTTNCHSSTDPYFIRHTLYFLPIITRTVWASVPKNGKTPGGHQCCCLWGRVRRVFFFFNERLQSQSERQTHGGNLEIISNHPRWQLVVICAPLKCMFFVDIFIALRRASAGAADLPRDQHLPS